MTSQNPFKLFLSLVAFDNTLRELEEKIKQSHSKKEALLQHKKQLANVVEKLKQQEHDVRKEVDLHELHMKELDTKERSKKDQLDDINTPKEYTVAKREIEAIQREQHDHERVLMQIWNTLESVHKTFEIKQQELVGALGAVDAEITTLNGEESQAQASYDEKMAERAQHVVGIPEDWLEKYRAMQSRVTDPVVPVQQGSCSACFYDITEQRLVALRRHALLQCEGCYRFLYMPEKSENSASSVGKGN
jgi:uncharacterized protein